jgi:hypothetical protein
MVLSKGLSVRMILEGGDWMMLRFAKRSVLDVARAKASMSCDFVVSKAFFGDVL